MYYDDKLSVISKFNSLYKTYYEDKVQELEKAHLRFVPFFIIEFSKILTEIHGSLYVGSVMIKYLLISL